MNESRGPLCEYEYRQTAEGVWTVTWLSRLVDGQETIKPHQKKPEEWKVPSDIERRTDHYQALPNREFTKSRADVCFSQG